MKQRKLFRALSLALLFILLLSACGSESPPPAAGGSAVSDPALKQESSQPAVVTMEMKICTVNGSSVRGVGLSETYPEAYCFSCTPEQLRGADAVLPGMVVEIGFDGNVMETWPAQIQAETVTLKEKQTDYFSLYKKILEDLYGEDPGLNSGAEYFGFDLAEIGALSAGEKALLAFDFSAEHNATPLEGTLQELMEQEYIDEEALYWENGVHFTINEEKIEGNTVSCSVRKWKGGLGAVGYPVRAAWEDPEGWSFEEIGTVWMS